MRRFYISRGIALFVMAAGALAYYFFIMPQPTAPSATLPTHVRAGGATIPVEVADTEAERIQGLSGRESLTPGTGLLFDFQSPGEYGIWMKDMRFSIDIIWANEGRVVTVLRDISPDTYPQIFTSVAPARYVLELPAGTAAAQGIVEGGDFTIE